MGPAGPSGGGLAACVTTSTYEFEEPPPIGMSETATIRVRLSCLPSACSTIKVHHCSLLALCRAKGHLATTMLKWFFGSCKLE